MAKSGGTAAPKKKNAAKAPPAAAAKPRASSASSSNGAEGLEVKDTRTSRSFSIPVVDSAIRATDLKKIKTDDPDDLGLVSYDPAFLNTASCRSAITYIDGDKGILRY